MNCQVAILIPVLSKYKEYNFCNYVIVFSSNGVQWSGLYESQKIEMRFDFHTGQKVYIWFKVDDKCPVYTIANKTLEMA